MRKIKYTITFTFLIGLFFHQSFSQEKEGVGVLLYSNAIKDANYHIYNPPFKARPIYKNTLEALNLYPEQLMSSMISANSSEWDRYNQMPSENTENSKKQDDQAEEKRFKNSDKNYYELLSKLSFNVHGVDMAIIKFYVHLEELSKPIGGALVIQKHQGRWKTVSFHGFDSLLTLMLYIKPEIIKRILKKEYSNDIEKKLIDSLYSSGKLDGSKLAKIQLDNVEREYLFNSLNWKQ